MSTYTLPARWFLHRAKSGSLVVLDTPVPAVGTFRGQVIATRTTCPDWEHYAPLIASAPELLSALQSLVELSKDPAGSTFTLKEIFGTFNQEQEIEGQRALAAIAKAGAQ